MRRGTHASSTSRQTENKEKTNPYTSSISPVRAWQIPLIISLKNLTSLDELAFLDADMSQNTTEQPHVCGSLPFEDADIFR